MDGALPPQPNGTLEPAGKTETAKNRSLTRKGLSKIAKHIEHRRWWEWLLLVVLIAGGIWAGNELTESDWWINGRYAAYQIVIKQIPRPVQTRRTVLVLIGDDEYWRGPLNFRSPIKRDYIAAIVDALREANVAVIAIDFDFRIPSPANPAPVEDPYEGETRQLIAAVKRASQNQKIILPKTIRYDDEHEYITQPDIYTAYNVEGGNIRDGYIALPPESRRLPWFTMQIKNGAPISSFSQAIALADNPRVLQGYAEKLPLPFGSFMTQDSFDSVSATDLLRHTPDAFDKLAHKIAIVGGVWHRLDYGQGPYIDQDTTPVGVIPGAYIHANYVEAMLDSRIYRPYEGKILLLIEILESVMVAIPFALAIRFFCKILLTLLFCVLLFGFSLFSLLALGLFFDFFVPVIVIVGHGIVERLVVGGSKN
jgi:CHASE2 domain-containing sensor protein